MVSDGGERIGCYSLPKSDESVFQQWINELHKASIFIKSKLHGSNSARR